MAPKRKATTAAKTKAESSAPKKPKASKDAEPSSADAAVVAATSDGKKLSLVIEAWATKLEKAVKEAVPDAVVSINPEKPRKGCFEVRDADGTKTYISLLDMPRPFTKLKALDIDELAKEIAGASA
ncbi:hypothetical protein COCOBI_14-4640 [Coccomyxa sp. Obi]|nr:hypothetical protein COCOBI_14-4640 [Coccomyxa sp. Obi]